VSIWFQELGMKFGAFQRSQGEVQQNVKPRSPRSTSDHVDPVGRSPCQVGPVGRLANSLPGRTTPLCSQSGQVLRRNISPYGSKKEFEATRSVHPQDPTGWSHREASQPLYSTASSSTFTTWPTLGPYKFPLVIPCKHTPHMSRIPPCKDSSFVS
jgi:hypothetical protein